MRRDIGLIAFLCVSVSSCLIPDLAARPQTAPARRPNIIVILCDDLGYGDLGCYGNRIIRTPNLDRLASQGTRFTQFYMTSPVCTPSRAALMTGFYPQRFGIHHADLPESLPRYPLPESAVTIAEVLKRAGYYTAHIGKWHLGEPPETVVPRKQGLDYFFGCFGGRPSSPWNRYARSMDPEIIVDENRPLVYQGHVTEVQTNAALDVLGRVPRNQPFFLNLWYNAPHEPLAPLANQGETYRHWSQEEQTYFQTVTDMDKGVGRIMARLDEMGIANETLILFSSDNGPEAHSLKYSRGSAGPLKGMKTQLWEGGVRVPAIMRWTGKVPAGKATDAITSVLDIFPTLCAAAGIGEKELRSMREPPAADRGIDLLPVVNGNLGETDRAIFFEFHFPQRGVESSLPMAVRRGKWKLFSNHALSAVQLYDLERDPGEQKDVAGENQSVVRELKSQLQRWWDQFAGKADLNRPRTSVPVPSPEELEKRHYRN